MGSKEWRKRLQPTARNSSKRRNKQRNKWHSKSEPGRELALEGFRAEAEPKRCTRPQQCPSWRAKSRQKTGTPRDSGDQGTEAMSGGVA